MQGHRKWAALLVLAVAACGGGGGGGGTPAPSGSITLDKTTLSASATTADAAPTGTVTVTISLTGASSPSVTATTTNSGVESVSATVNNASKATVTVTFKTPATLAAATYDDTITIKACTDASCATALTGSPATVTTHYTVTQASAGSVGTVTANTTSVSVSAAANGAAPTGTVKLTMTKVGGTLPTVRANPTESVAVNGIQTVTPVVSSTTHGAVDLQFASPGSLAVGTYSGTVIIDVCADSACTQPLTGSPITVNTQYVITAAPPATVTVSGTVTFDKVPGSATGVGLDYANLTQAPARAVLVEAVQTSDRTTVAASGSTDAAGHYSLEVPANTGLFLQVKAEMVRTGTPAWHYRVLDNTQGNALYAITGADFDSGAASSQHDLNAASGWGGSSYTGSRDAAPFAILDTVYQATQLVLGASSTAVFPDLDLFWSVKNIPSTTFDPTTGDVETTQFLSADPAGNPPTTVDEIFVLGDANVDTDEYDASVIAHEWGHYFQDSFSRDDSFGGVHALSDRLDLRVAFSEGWGDAFSGMAIGRSVYQDSNGSAQAGGDCLGLESDAQLAVCGKPANLGWYNEASVARVLWDVFDSVNDGADTVSLGFGPIFTVMNTDMATTRSLTSIYPFAAALKTRNPSAASGIDAILNGQSIAASAPNFDEWGTGETNDAGDASILPLYTAATVPGTVSNVCSNDNFDGGKDGNKIGESKYLKFTLGSTRTLTFKATRASGPSSTDPDMELYGAGLVASAESSVNNSETFTQTLAAGTYVLEVFEYSNTTATPKGLTCFNVSIN